MKNENGGAAFTGFNSTRKNAKCSCVDSGMTLRDWFAGQALAGMSERIKQNGSDLDVSDVAFCAYFIADAMLDEREKE
jgi:hypothetical protein